MAKRLVIIGGVAAGASAAAKARRISEDIEIVLIEAGPYISFANCGLPYYLGGQIEKRDSLFVTDAKSFARRFNVDVRVNTTATSVDAERRTVMLAATGRQESQEKQEKLSYDSLILATGADAVRPPIDGLDGENVFTLRTVPDVDAIIERLGGVAAGLRALIIGGGFIGLEAAEQLLRRGLDVTVVEMAGQLLPVMDIEMAWPVREALVEAGAEVLLSDGVSKIVRDGSRCTAATRGGREIAFDIGILATGVRPNVALARLAGVKTGPTGAIAVDRFGRTGMADIYAAGDNSETRHLVLDHAVNIPLAGPAGKAGRAAGANAALDLTGAADDDPRRLRLDGVLGTAIVRVCGTTAAVTGLTESQAVAHAVDCGVTYMPAASHAGYYGGAGQMVLKLVWASDTGRLLGAQAVGGLGIDKRIDVLATAIAGRLSVEDLEQLDLCYSPPFSSARDAPVMAGFAAANTRRGLMDTITPDALLDELAGPAAPAVIDVRTPREFQAGHLPQAVNVPLDEIRARLAEVPADKPLAVHCAAGYRSYLAQCILVNNGRTNVRNVLGGWLMIRRVIAARDGSLKA